MSRIAQPASHAAWRHLIDLGERLMDQPTIISKRNLIVDAAASLIDGQAELWLADALRRLPDVESSACPVGSQPDGVRAAFKTARVQRTDADDRAPAIAVPLRSHDQVIGVLHVVRPAGPPFTTADVDLLEGLAVQAAVALYAAQQVSTERWRVEQLSLVRVVSAQVANVFDLDELCRRVTALIFETFRYYYVALFTLEPGHDVLHFRASAGAPHASPTGLPELEAQLGQGIIGHVAQSGEEILASDVSREPRYRYENGLPETRSEIALPLKIGGRVLGVLDVQSDQIDDFREIDVLVLRALSDSIAIAVEDARLYSNLERQAGQLAAVAEVTGAVASVLDLDALLEKAVALVHERLGYPAVHLFTVDPACRCVTFQAASGRHEEVLDKRSLTYALKEDAGLIPWVACTGQALLLDDAQEDPRYRPAGAIHPHTRAMLIVPLVFGGEVLGVFDVQSEARAAFSADDLRLLKTVGDNLAVAVRNASLYRSERWRRQVADSLREVAGLLSAEVALDQVLDAILIELKRTLPSDAAGIWLLEDHNLCLAAAHGYGRGVCIGDFYLESDTWLGQALRAPQPSIRTTASAFEPLGASLGFPKDYSAIAAPLRAGEESLGLLVLVHRSAGRYGGESQAMTAAFASYAAVAIKNTRLYQETQELALISTVMLRVVEATQSLGTLGDVLETVVHLVPMLVGVDRCAILLWNEAVKAFLPVASYGLDAQQKKTFEQWHVAPGDEAVFDDMLVEKAPVFIYDSATDSRLSGTDIWALGFDSLLVLPLLAQGSVLGVMLMEYQGEWFGLAPVDVTRNERLAIIQGIAHQTAAAVESTQLREAQQEEAYVSAALLQVAQAVASLNTLDEILGTIARVLPLLVGIERCLFFLWDERRGAFRLAQGYGIPKDANGAQHFAPGDFPLLDVVRERGRVLSYPDDVKEADASYFVPEHIADRFLTHASAPTSPLTAVPLAVKDDVLGVMLLEERGAARRFREKWTQIITGIADQAALAIQSDMLQQEMVGRERLERELQLAHEIQQTFIPTELPSLPGMELAATWRAARQVAGDFYDIFELPDGRVGLVIADVADKGMPAALFMTLTRTLMRAAALEETSTSAALARVNTLLVPDAKHGMFVTAMYAIFSPASGELNYANAGHTLPLLIRAQGGDIEQFCKGGMALGVMDGVRFEERSVILEPGDVVVFFTDGVTEAYSPQGGIYGNERLWDTIREAGHGSAEEMLEAVVGSVLDFAGGPYLSDDLTLLILRRLEQL
ncbi:MAG: GAF domain-containing protein [Anaerolineae bacterium]|nr:GAF domain-containing protein [Anaerolineae bacterium]